MIRRAGLVAAALCASAVAGLPATGHVARDSAPAAQDIVTRYLAKQTVPSELLYASMAITAPGVPKKEYRFLVLQKRHADGRRDSLLRLVRPKDVEGVTLLARQLDAETFEQHL